jgi:hypothetical protein
MRKLGLLGATLWALLVPAFAQAESGAVTDIHAVEGGQLQATFTATHTFCTSFGYCGWFPEASQVPAGSPCDQGRLVWVGSGSTTSGTETQTATFYPLGTGSLTLCVYVYDTVNGYQLVGQATYTPPAAAPPPASPVVAPLTIAEAQANLPGILRHEFHARFANRRNFTRACLRFSSETVRCRVAWLSGPFRYSGAVMLKNNPDDPANSIRYRTSVHRTRVGSTPARSPSTPSSPTTPAPSSNCNSNYGGVCLPLTGDVDCSEIAAHDFPVIGSDPFRLDGDGDGIACES